MMRTAAILPVKRFPLAKQRLGQSVEDSLRADLARAMVGDVLSALRECSAIDATIVVTREPTVAAAARYIGAVAVEDLLEQGQSAAVSMGLKRALEDGFQRALCIPGDCPTLEPDELHALLDGGSDQNILINAGSASTVDVISESESPLSESGSRGTGHVVIVPDRHGSGTNALLLTPPDALSPSFGPDSRARHEQLAHEAGVHLRVAQPASLLLDIDTGADLAVLRERLAGEQTRAPRTRTVLDRAGAAPPRSSEAA